MDKILNGYVDSFYMENIFGRLSFFKHGKNNRRCIKATLLTGCYHDEFEKLKKENKMLCKFVDNIPGMSDSEITYQRLRLVRKIRESSSNSK